MRNKPCIFVINGEIYYTSEKYLSRVPYFERKYSGYFSEKVEEVEENVMQEYVLNFDMFEDISSKICEIFMSICDVNMLNIEVSVKQRIQINKIFDYLNISKSECRPYDSDSYECCYNIDDRFIKISTIYGLEDLDELHKIYLSDSDRIIYIDYLHNIYGFLEYREKEQYVFDNINIIFPGSLDRYNMLNCEMRKYIDTKLCMMYYGETTLWILTGKNKCGQIQKDIPDIIYIYFPKLMNVLHMIEKYLKMEPKKYRYISTDGYRNIAKICLYFEDRVIFSEKSFDIFYSFSNVYIELYYIKFITNDYEFEDRENEFIYKQQSEDGEYFDLYDSMFYSSGLSLTIRSLKSYEDCLDYKVFSNENTYIDIYLKLGENTKQEILDNIY